MTVKIESERHLHRTRVYIPNSNNIVALYTLSHLLRTREEEFHIYYQASADERDDELIKKICPRAMRHEGPAARGMERSVLFLRDGMDENELKIPHEGYHRFVLIVSVVGAGDPSRYPFATPFSKLEHAAKSIGFESYCVLRLPPIYQNLDLIKPGDLETVDDIFFGIDAEDAGSAISHILSDPELHRGEEYTIFGPSGISPATLKTVHSQLPRAHGEPLQSPGLVLESIKTKRVWPENNNDFSKITGGEEMTSFEEFLRRTNQSLFHQRFILKN